MPPRYHRLLFSILTFCLFETAVWAQTDELYDALPSPEYINSISGLSSGDLVKLTLERNPQILAIRQRLTETQGLLKQAALSPNPDLSFSITDGSILNSPGEREYSVSYVHTFELGGKRTRRVDVAAFEVQSARYEIANQQRELVADVKTAYAEALAAIRNLEVLRQTLDLIQKINEITIQRVREGESPTLEEGLSTVELNRVKAEFPLISSQVQSKISELKLVSGINADQALLLKTEFSFEDSRIDSRDLLMKALESRPDLQAARLQEKKAESEIALAKAEAISNVNGLASYTRSLTQFDQFGLDDTRQLVPLKDRDNTISAGISINLPFRNRNQGNIQAAISRKETARLRTQALEKSIGQEVASAVITYKAALEALRIFSNNILPQSSKNLEVVRASYELGELRFLDLIQEQRRAFEIQNAYTDVLKTYYLSIIQLEKATGVPLAGQEE